MSGVVLVTEPTTIVQVQQNTPEVVQVLTQGPQGARGVKGSTGDGMVTLPKIMKATTVSGNAWVAFEDYACNNLVIMNALNVSIDVRRNGGGDFITMVALTDRAFGGIENSNEIEVRLSGSEDEAGLEIQAEAQTLV